MREYNSPGFFEELHRKSDRFYAMANEVLATLEATIGVPARLQGVGPRFCLLLGQGEECRSYEAAARGRARPELHQAFKDACFRRGPQLPAAAPSFIVSLLPHATQLTVNASAIHCLH